MKKAFLVASLSVWTLGLLVGVGFSVVGHVTGVQQLPGENYQLRVERNSLQDTIDTERHKHARDIQNYIVAIDRWKFQSNKMVESLRLDTTIETPRAMASRGVTHTHPVTDLSFSQTPRLSSCLECVAVG